MYPPLQQSLSSPWSPLYLQWLQHFPFLPLDHFLRFYPCTSLETVTHLHTSHLLISLLSDFCPSKPKSSDYILSVTLRCYQTRLSHFPHFFLLWVHQGLNYVCHELINQHFLFPLLLDLTRVEVYISLNGMCFSNIVVFLFYFPLL